MSHHSLFGALPSLTVYAADLRAREAATLPALPSLALHGALGTAMKRAECGKPTRGACVGCADQESCAYALLFEPAPRVEGASFPGVGDDVPRPLGVFPEVPYLPVDGLPFELDDGSVARFRVVLVGASASRRVGALEAALEAAGRAGIGRGAARRRPAFDLARLEAVHPPPERRPRREIPLWLSTPLRLKSGGKVASSLRPHAFVEGVTRRAEALAAFHGEPWAERPATEELAAGLSIESRLRVVEVRRRSSRQAAAMTWPGLVGTVLLRGPSLPALWPLLRFCSLAGLGKATTFGFGRFEVLEP